jgi:hypothetical protein
MKFCDTIVDGMMIYSNEKIQQRIKERLSKSINEMKTILFYMHKLFLFVLFLFDQFSSIDKANFFWTKEN